MKKRKDVFGSPAACLKVDPEIGRRDDLLNGVGVISDLLKRLLIEREGVFQHIKGVDPKRPNICFISIVSIDKLGRPPQAIADVVGEGIVGAVFEP